MGHRTRRLLAVGLLVAAALSVAPLPPAGAQGAAPTDGPLQPVAVVGDSIFKEASPHISAVLGAQGRPLAHLDTRNAALIEDLHAATVAAVAAPAGPDILVLGVGTAQANDTYWPFEGTWVGLKWMLDLRGLLEDVTPHVSCVRVFDIQERDTGFYLGVDRYAEEMNALTRQVVAEFDGVEYFHYRHWTDLENLRYDLGDRLHHNGPGRWAVARLVQDAADGCDPATSTEPFWDVRPGHWAATEIAWMAARGLAFGYDNGSYRALVGEFRIPVTRGQALNMLWNLEGAPAVATAHGWVDGMAWLQGPLNWAWSEGIATGYPDGTFRPAWSISRAQLARMIWERAGSPVASVPHGWSDGAPWVDDALDWIAEQGLMTGWPDGTFRPNRAITRAEIARLLFRVDQLAAPPVSTPPPTTAVPPETTVPPPTTATPTSSTSSAPAPPTTGTPPTR